ncbi:MAG TPA: tRNA (adenosine(37)-N6)-threonylcarbamoyltransferase complex ATPase subunit type 1 TsaE [Bacillota bacterium]
MKSISLTLKTAELTYEMGRLLGELVKPGDLLFLFGELGAGKTTLTKGIAYGLGVTAAVTSPTFQLLKSYQGRYSLYHLDLYRLKSSLELDILEPEVLAETGVMVIEWGQLLLERLGPTYLEIIMEFAPDGAGRIVTINSKGPEYDHFLESLSHAHLGS